MSIPYGYCQCGCGQRTNIAKATAKEKGWIKGEPHKFVIGHSQMGKYRVTFANVLDRLDRDVSTGCWLWTGTIADTGYGRVGFEGKSTHVHRLVYEHLRGPIARGHHLHHICEVPACANPDHLIPLTPREHKAAHPPVTPARHNAKKTHCPQGHPYDEVNTRWHKGWRQCIACKNARNRVRYHRPEEARG